MYGKKYNLNPSLKITGKANKIEGFRGESQD